MKCETKLDAIARALERADLTLADRAVAAYLLIRPMKASDLVAAMGVSRTTAYRIIAAVKSSGIETGVPSVGLKSPVRGTGSPVDGTQESRIWDSASPVDGTQNGGNQPLFELETRARVESDSSLKKERKKEEVVLRATPATSVAEPKLKSSPKRKPTLIPADWKPTDADRTYAISLGLDPELVAEDHVAYWSNRCDAKARKLDWSKAYQTTVRMFRERRQFQLRQPGDPRQPTNGAERPRPQLHCGWL